MMKFLFFILCFFIFSCDSSEDGGNGGSGSTIECGDGICDEGETETTCAEDCQTVIVCSDDTQEGFCENPQYVGNVDQYECFPCEFVHSTSSQLGFYTFKEVTIDNQQIEHDDWVGAFNGDVCVGSRRWGDCNGDSICDVPVLGDDGESYSQGYMSIGDIPTFKIYDASENNYVDATPSEEVAWTSGNFTPVLDLLSASSNPFNFELEETGASTLFIFNADADQNPIINLNIGDEVALFDSNGVLDNTGATGELLVGAGVWTGSQLEVTAIGAVDLSDFGGPIVPGYIEGNSMILKVWDASEQLVCSANYTASTGSGLFNNLFTTINSITLVCD